MTVGIPRGLLYYKYNDLWKTFFHELNIKTIYSPETNNQILENGKFYSIDESCLSLKIFLGHVSFLINKCDYILIPRIVCINKGEKMCINFSALYDIVKNIFKIKILNYNIDIKKGDTEEKAFIKIGKELGKNTKETKNAYNKAKIIFDRINKEKFFHQINLLNKSNKNKILIVSHPYNTYDKLIGEAVVKYLKDLNIEVIYADIYEKQIEENYKSISSKVYWTYNKELLESIIFYYKKVDGIILLTSFPCGPDSLTNEMCIRKLNIPITNIIIDELYGEAGLQTRIESFVDIINQKKVCSE